MKKICVLGVTGSIGQQTVDVVKHHRDEFEIVAMSAGRNIDLLEQTMTVIHAKHICVQNEEDMLYLQRKYKDVHFYCGQEGLVSIATLSEIDIVLNAIVGFAGLLPTMNAIKAHKDIALANKETLVVAGHLIIPLIKEYGVQLLPVDSEHSAIFQCINGEYHGEINKIILTASGGSFRDKTRSELSHVSVEDALKHPNWSMGAKITIDSATLFNKGLEVMEAKWLFDVDYDDIEVLIHPESIIHSMVEYKDTAVIAQLGTPDMRLPIQYALTYPHRFPLMGGKRLSLSEVGTLHFEKPDFHRFHALALAYEAGCRGGSMPCVLNGANEQANTLFLKKKIEFLDIEKYVEEAMRAHHWIDHPTLEQLIEIDQWARNFVKERVGEI